MRDSLVSAPGTRRIDLNADLGEGFGVWRLGDDDALLGVVTSANVACGFHAGDPSTMRRVCARRRPRASRSARRSPTATWPGSAAASWTSSRTSWPTTCSTNSPRSTGSPAPPGARVSYVKPHGALYNPRSTTRGTRGGGRRRRWPTTAGCRCSGCPVRRCCAVRRRRACAPSPEGFADRGYTADGTLVPRGEPGALVSDPAVVAERAVRMAADGVVVAVDGTTVC